MNRLVRTSSATLTAVALTLGAVSALVAADAASPAVKKPPPSIRIIPKAFTVTVAATAAGSATIPDKQRLSTMCGSKEYAVAQGIISSTHPVTSQSFGPAAGSAFVVGAAGTAKVRTQLLCAKNVTVRHYRKAAKFIAGGATSSYGTARGALTCPAGFAPSGMQTTLDYAPGFGAYSSLPNGARGWLVQVEKVPSSISQYTEPAWVDMACIKAASVTKVTKTTVVANGVATTSATCAGSRRALGWGMKVDAYTGYASGNDDWATPYVSRAQFTPNGKTMNFTFRVPAAQTVTKPASEIQVQVVCGVPKS